MSFFISFAQTGENVDLYTQRMQRIKAVMDEAAVDMYCILFDDAAQRVQGPKLRLQQALGRLSAYDQLIVIVTSSRRSEGMLIEVGAALALGKPVHCLQHVTAAGTMYLPEMCDQSMVWATEAELDSHIKSLIVHSR